MKEPKHRDDRGLAQAFGLASQLGLSMAICIIIGVLVGQWLDRQLGTTPWMLILGVLFGAASSFKVLYDLVMKKWRL